MYAIVRVNYVNCWLISVEHQGFHGDGQHVFRAGQLQGGVGVHSRSDGEVLVLYVDLRLHGARFEIHVPGKANDLAGNGPVEGVDADLHRVTDVDIFDIVFGHGHAETQKPVLCEFYDGKILLVRIGATLDERAGIGIAPDDDSVDGRNDIG